MRTNAFDVNIALPPALQALASNSNFTFINQFNELQPFRAFAVSPPSAAFRTAETHNQGIGPRIKQPVEAILPNLPISFLADSGGVIESFFTLWMNLGVNFSYNPTTGGSFATYYTGYRSDIVSPTVTINKYDKSGTIVSNYLITNAIPMVLVPTPMSWADNDRLQAFTVQLHFTSFDIT